MSITDDPIAIFLYAVKSPESKRQYPRRFKMFLDFLTLPGDLNSQAKKFLGNAKANPKWIEDKLIDFIAYQNERARQGDISVYTIPNYYRATKLLCEMNGVILSWKKIACGMERVRKSANDRAPT